MRDAHGRAAIVNVDAGNAPVADNPRRRALRKILLPFAERQIVDGGEFEVVRDIVLADRFFEAAIVQVSGVAYRGRSIALPQALSASVRIFEKTYDD